MFNFLFKDKKKNEYIDFLDYIVSQKKIQQSIYQKNLYQAVDIIASYISKIKINVYKYDYSTKKFLENEADELFFKLNIRPNSNMNATQLKYELISKYLLDKEALLININKQLFLADSFKKSDTIIKERYYYDIKLKSINSNILSINKIVNASDAIFLNLSNKRIKDFLEIYYQDFGKMLNIASSQFISMNSNKYKMKKPGQQMPIVDSETNKEITYEQYKRKIAGSLFEEGDSIILLSEYLGLENLNENSRVSSNDYLSLLDKWEKDVSSAFAIPPDIFHKNKTEKSNSDSDFINYCILPIIVQLEEELNNALFGISSYKRGYVRFNRYALIYHDPLDSSTSIDKMFSNGYTHNTTRKFLDLDLVPEEWANSPNITKNYGSLKGGDENE